MTRSNIENSKFSKSCDEIDKCEDCGFEIGTNKDCSYCKQYAEQKTIGEL